MRTWRRHMMKTSTCCLTVLALVFLLAAFSASAIAAEDPSGWYAQSSGTTSDLYGVSAVDGDTAWAVGNGGTILKTTDGGASWSPQASGTTDNLVGVSAVDADTAWAVGYTSILKTDDGGSTWTTQYELANGMLSGVSAADGNHAWAVGGTTPYPGEGLILFTGDGGSNWSLQPSAAFFGYYLAVCAVDADNVWASGGPPATYYGSWISKTSDGGATWTPMENGYRYGFYGVAAADPDTAWVTSDLAHISGTVDGGENWTMQNGGDYYSVMGISAVDGQNAWATASYDSTVGMIMHTTNGARWGMQFWTTARLVSVSAADVNNVWAVGSSGTIIHTIDGGGAGGNPLPRVTKISPSVLVGWGAPVVIEGSDFGATQGTSYVSFGSEKSTEYTGWSDNAIACNVPDWIEGDMPMTVTTSNGTSNPIIVDVSPSGLSAQSTEPSYGVSGVVLDVTVNGTGFTDGTTVSLEKGTTRIDATNPQAQSSKKLTCSVDLRGAELGKYDVVVRDDTGQQYRKTAAFSVTNVCGGGAGASLAIFGTMMGLLALAGTAGLRKRW